jgi:hypothetical protein
MFIVYESVSGSLGVDCRRGLSLRLQDDAIFVPPLAPSQHHSPSRAWPAGTGYDKALYADVEF